MSGERRRPPCTPSACPPAAGSTWCRTAISSSRRRSAGRPTATAGQRQQGRLDLDRDPAVRIETEGFTPVLSLLLLACDIPIDRKWSGPVERRFRLSHSSSTNACFACAQLRPRTCTERHHVSSCPTYCRLRHPVRSRLFARF